MKSVKIALKDIQQRENKGWVVYADSWNFVQSIEFNKESHQYVKSDIWDLIGTPKQNKQMILCKVLAHIGIEGSEETDNASKLVIDVIKMTTIKLLF